MKLRDLCLICCLLAPASVMALPAQGLAQLKIEVEVPACLPLPEGEDGTATDREHDARGARLPKECRPKLHHIRVPALEWCPAKEAYVPAPQEVQRGFALALGDVNVFVHGCEEAPRRRLVQAAREVSGGILKKHSRTRVYLWSPTSAKAARVLQRLDVSTGASSRVDLPDESTCVWEDLAADICGREPPPELSGEAWQRSRPNSALVILSCDPRIDEEARKANCPDLRSAPIGCLEVRRHLVCEAALDEIRKPLKVWLDEPIRKRADGWAWAHGVVHQTPRGRPQRAPAAEDHLQLARAGLRVRVLVEGESGPVEVTYVPEDLQKKPLLARPGIPGGALKESSGGAVAKTSGGASSEGACTPAPRPVAAATESDEEGRFEALLASEGTTSAMIGFGSTFSLVGAYLLTMAAVGDERYANARTDWGWSLLVVGALFAGGAGMSWAYRAGREERAYVPASKGHAPSPAPAAPAHGRRQPRNR